MNLFGQFRTNTMSALVMSGMALIILALCYTLSTKLSCTTPTEQPTTLVTRPVPATTTPQVKMSDYDIETILLRHEWAIMQTPTYVDDPLCLDPHHAKSTCIPEASSTHFVFDHTSIDGRVLNAFNGTHQVFRNPYSWSLKDGAMTLYEVRDGAPAGIGADISFSEDDTVLSMTLKYPMALGLTATTTQLRAVNDCWPKRLSSCEL